MMYGHLVKWRDLVPFQASLMNLKTRIGRQVKSTNLVKRTARRWTIPDSVSMATSTHASLPDWCTKRNYPAASVATLTIQL